MKIKVCNKEANESRARNPTYTIEISDEEIDHFINHFVKMLVRHYIWESNSIKGLEGDTKQ